MENEELIKQCTEKAQKWLAPEYDAETQAEVKRMLENSDKTDLIEAFYKDLEFGTGGLRGIMGVAQSRHSIDSFRCGLMFHSRFQEKRELCSHSLCRHPSSAETS